ncbi:hypothetical protein N9E91_05415 [Alphaproteobacteria bacterium]|jgi:hypothetical protein|nr:hypothetical protein [SAR116 cluster bacterium]MDA9930663.1 hypothetical protein [Alphaproteobacteria bacterium]
MRGSWWIMVVLLSALAIATIWNSEFGGPKKRWHLCKESLATQMFTGECTLRFDGEMRSS